MVSVQTFVEFIRKKDIGRIKFAIREAQFFLDSIDEDGRTALHYAVELGAQVNDLSMVRLLLGYGADVSIRDETLLQETPLHLALRLEHVGAVKLLLESCSFDVIQCDTFQRKKIISTNRQGLNSSSTRHGPGGFQQSTVPDDASSTVQPSSSGALVLVRQNSRCLFDGGQPEFDEDQEGSIGGTVGDVIIIQDECVGSLPLVEIIASVCQGHRPPVSLSISNHLRSVVLTGLYVVDSRLDLDEDDIISGSPSAGGGLFDSLAHLRTLVLSNTRLRQLPRGVATCLSKLEVLKVDGNRFEDLPSELDQLASLTTLCLDRQRPRMRALPAVVSRLAQLQVLSISNNRIEDLQPLTALRSLRILRADHNRIARLPVGLVALRDLVVLDVSHNRLESIPPSLVELVAHLYRFDYYNASLRPRRCRRDQRQLIGHLELDLLLAVNRPLAVRDLTIAIVGERRCGKTTLADTLRRLVSTSGLSSSSNDFRSTGSIPDAVLSAECGGGDDGCSTRSASSGLSWTNVIELSCGGYLDAYVGDLDVDLVLLAFDATSLHAAGAGHTHNGGPALTSRHVTRLQMWLQALYEMAPDTPVVLVGTRADMVRSSSGAAYSDIWTTIDALLTTCRPHHSRRYPVATCSSAVPTSSVQPDETALSCSMLQQPTPTCNCVTGSSTSRSNCIICCRVDPMSASTLTVARRLYAKSRPGGLGFVEVPPPPTTATSMHAASSASTAASGAANGHTAVTSPGVTDDGISGNTYRSMVQISSSNTGSARFPHVVGYFEIDGRFRKDCKSGVHHGLEQLRAALPRLATGYGGQCASAGGAGSTSHGGAGMAPGNCRSTLSANGSGGGVYRIPRSWVSLLCVLSDIGRHRTSSSSGWVPPPNAAPFVVVDDLRTLGRKCDIPTAQIQHALSYFHRRGKLVYFGASSNTSTTHSNSGSPAGSTPGTSVGSAAGGGSGGGGNSTGPCGGDDPLVRLAVVDCAWFVQRVGRLLASRLPSRCTAADVVRSTADREADLWLRQRLQLVDSETSSGTIVDVNHRGGGDSTSCSRGGSTDIFNEFDSPTGRWMLAAMERLELCIPLEDTTRTTQQMPDIRNRVLLVPALLEYGSPSHDVWPDNPEWEERQITCDFGVRTLRPCMFADFIVRLNGPDGRRQLKIVPDPVPVYLSHHVVFFSAVDQGGCTDCYNVRRRMRAKQPRHPHTDDSGDMEANDVIMAASAADGSDDDALHKVHVMLHNRMDAIRVQVRGTSPCCTMKAVLGFLELFLNDAPDEELSDASAAAAHGGASCAADSMSLDGASFSSRTTTTSTSCYGGAGGGVASTSGLGGCTATNGRNSPSGGVGVVTMTGGSEGSLGSIYAAATPTSLPLAVGIPNSGGALLPPPAPTIDESFSSSATTDDPRDLFLLCPKCVLLRHSHPGRIAYHCVSPPKRRTTAAVCRKWHNLGSWARATTGDYRFSSVVEVPPSAAMTILPDYEHPRLVLILPPGQRLSYTDWYLFGHTRFLDGFEVHFLCEYTGYWHMTDDVGFWLSSSSTSTPSSSNTTSGSNKRPGSGMGGSSGGSAGGPCSAGGNQVPVLLNMALSLVQIVHGIPEHSNNCRLVAPVVAALLKTYDYLRVVDAHAQPDTYAWLTKNKDRVVAMLTKVLASASDGAMADLYFRVNNPLNAHTAFQSPSVANRQHLARHLRIDSSSGRFGALRPIYVEREIRWVCDAHYEELRSAPT